MAIATARDVIKQAMKKIGILAAGEEPAAAEAVDALETLNSLLSSWSGDSLITPATIQEGFALITSQNSYTIGSELNFDTVKPLRIISAFIRSSSGIDYPVTILPRNRYNALADKTTEGRPTNLFYDPGVAQQATQTGTVYLYLTPDSAYTLYLISEKAFTEFAGLTTAFTFPDTYKRAMIFNLAVELAPEYERNINPDIRAIAAESKQIIENMNVANKRQLMSVSLPGSATNFDFKAG
jgi:hypothetical protein